MGRDAHDAIPALVQLAERRCAHGPFHFERAEHIVGASFVSLLAVVATALGQCGRGVAHWQEAHAMLTRLTAFQEEDVRTAAMRALDDLGSPLASNLVGRRT
jgi:hypothetical protein